MKPNLKLLWTHTICMNKIFCFGDGYAANHIWPEWPAIVQALYPEHEHENFGAVGAGNEFIASAVVHAHQQQPDAFFIVQWAMDKRFDKMLQDDSWNQIIDHDPIYHFNRVKLQDHTWWLSSASHASAVQTYHRFYVQEQQQALRSQNWKYLIKHLLASQALFFCLDDLQKYDSLPRFQQVRQQEVQPSPVVHMSWVEEHILPYMPVQPSPARLNLLKQRINQHSWVPYDPDREEIWYKMSKI